MEPYTEKAPYPAVYPDQKAAKAYPQQPYPPQPQGGAYPPACAAQQPVVMQPPPAPAQAPQMIQQTVIVTGARGSGVLIVAIIVSVISFCCGVWPMVFSLAGVCLALAANDASSEESSRSLSKASKGCSFGAIVAIVVQWIIVIVIIAVTISSAKKAVDASRINNYNLYG